MCAHEMRNVSVEDVIVRTARKKPVQEICGRRHIRSTLYILCVEMFQWKTYYRSNYYQKCRNVEVKDTVE